MLLHVTAKVPVCEQPSDCYFTGYAVRVVARKEDETEELLGTFEAERFHLGLVINQHDDPLLACGAESDVWEAFWSTVVARYEADEDNDHVCSDVLMLSCCKLPERLWPLVLRNAIEKIGSDCHLAAYDIRDERVEAPILRRLGFTVADGFALLDLTRVNRKWSEPEPDLSVN